MHPKIETDEGYLALSIAPNAGGSRGTRSNDSQAIVFGNSPCLIFRETFIYFSLVNIQIRGNSYKKRLVAQVC